MVEPSAILVYLPGCSLQRTIIPQAMKPVSSLIASWTDKTLALPCGIALLCTAMGLLAACGATPEARRPSGVGVSPDIELLAFRLRSDFDVDLNADSGWAAGENEAARLAYDSPFRLRVQVRANAAPPAGYQLGLQYRWQGSDWSAVGVSDFPYPAFATPFVSVVTTGAYAHGAETERLLGPADIEWDEAAGLNRAAMTPVWRAAGEALEWEWPLVVRRFADGPAFAEDDAVFDLRVVDAAGRPLSGPLSGPNNIRLTLSAPHGHLGGTFVETPGRLGPYQSAQGHLYFIMEPTETDNRFMMVKSTDFGASWREIDGGNRPRADDLEGVASARFGNVIHILHQVSRGVYYHAFEMGAGVNDPGRWLVDSERLADHEEPPTQYADLVARSDGSLVAVFSGPNKLAVQFRTPQGAWGQPQEIDTDTGPDLSGPVMVTGRNDVITLAYTGRDGSGFARHLRPDGSFTPRQLLSTSLGTDDPENGAILPLVDFPVSGETAIVYRQLDGRLYEKRFTEAGELSAPVRISDFQVTTDAVDSEQAGADIVRHGTSLHLIFIEENTRSIYYSRSDRLSEWSVPETIIEGIDAGWLRGSVHTSGSGNPVYGFVYDAGSRGGSGFNRYFALPLQ